MATTFWLESLELVREREFTDQWCSNNDANNGGQEGR